MGVTTFQKGLKKLNLKLQEFAIVKQKKQLNFTTTLSLTIKKN
jgi:hypothetical protein